MSKSSERNRRDPELNSTLAKVGLAFMALVLLILGTHLLITTIQKGREVAVSHG